MPIILGSADFALAAGAPQDTNTLYGSGNWSGYFDIAPSGGFTDISASWVVPTVVPSSTGTTYTSDWVGFDGATDSTVEQCGTSEQVTRNGAATYFAWFEFAPQETEQEVNLTIHPGDTIDAETTYEAALSSTGNYVYDFIIKDVTTGQTFNQDETTTSNDPRSTAEWIAEAPSNGDNILTLANFNTITFSGDQAALNGGSDQSLGSLGDNEIEMIQNGYLAALPTNLNAGGNAFTVNYIASVTWDNVHGSSPDDGQTWDIGTSHNWNNGATNNVYTDGSNVTFNDSNNGHYAVTLNTTVNPSSVTVNNSNGNYTISGTGSIAGTGFLIKTGAGTLTLSTANTYSGGTGVEEGLLEIASTGSSTTSSLPNGLLSVTGGEVQIAPNVTLGSQSASPAMTAPTSNVNIQSLSISGGTLDITNNHIIIDYGSGPDPISSIAGLIVQGYAGGTWTGTGITSSTAAANAGSYGIGYADAADPGNPAGLASGQIEVMYTLLGDANLDGKVNGADFTILAANFNQGGKSWDQGDFNYDGSVNGADFTLLAENFDQSASQSAIGAADLAALNDFAVENGIGMSSVPEPMSASLLLAGVGVLCQRRRRS